LPCAGPRCCARPWSADRRVPGRLRSRDHASGRARNHVGRAAGFWSDCMPVRPLSLGAARTVCLPNNLVYWRHAM